MTSSCMNKPGLCKQEHVKSEQTDVNDMASPIIQFQYQHDDPRASTNHIKSLDQLIKSSTDLTDLIQFRSQRGDALFHSAKYNDALQDIEFIEQNSLINDALITLKWKSIAHVTMNKVREAMKASLGMKLMDNSDHMKLLMNMSEENINELINKNHKRKSTTERKMKKIKL